MRKDILKDAKVGDTAVFKNGGKSKIIHIALKNYDSKSFYVRFEGNKIFGACFHKGHLMAQSMGEKPQKSVFSIVKIIKAKKVKK